MISFLKKLCYKITHSLKYKGFLKVDRLNIYVILSKMMLNTREHRHESYSDRWVQNPTEIFRKFGTILCRLINVQATSELNTFRYTTCSKSNEKGRGIW